MSFFQPFSSKALASLLHIPYKFCKSDSSAYSGNLYTSSFSKTKPYTFWTGCLSSAGKWESQLFHFQGCFPEWLRLSLHCSTRSSKEVVYLPVLWYNLVIYFFSWLFSKQMSSSMIVRKKFERSVIRIQTFLLNIWIESLLSPFRFSSSSLFLRFEALPEPIF